MASDKVSYRTSPAALLSVPVGLTGPLGVLFGYYALYEVNASEGRLRGRYLAYMGMGLGIVVSAAMLLGSIAIGVNHMRALSGRAECANNLRQTGAAVHKYYDLNDNTYPRGSNGPATLPPEKRLSFHATLLAYMEQRPGTQVKYAQLAGTLDFGLPWDVGTNLEAAQTTIPSYACRDDTGLLPDQRGVTNYVGITGIGAGAATLPVDSPAAGFFGYERTVHDADIQGGTSYLVIVTETTVDNGSWASSGRPTLRELPVDESKIPAQAAYLLGMAGSGDGPTPLLMLPILCLGDGNTPPYIGPGRPFGGLHQGGANVLHADGSVVFLNNSIRADVFRSLVLLQREKLDVIEPPN
jgi:prepilin-type processing-associated H-X9-DG protein